MDRRVIDLAMAAESLSGEDEKLKHLIWQLRDAHSMRADLNMAVEFMDSLDELSQSGVAGKSEMTNDSAVLALLYSAIILYSRATNTSSDHRKHRFHFHNHYNADQKEKHGLLCDLRDDAVAHFGPGPMYGGKVFHSDYVTVMLNPDGSTVVATLSTRVVIQRSLADTVREMAERALGLADGRTSELNQMVSTEMHDRLKKSPELGALLKSHMVDLADLLGNETAAQKVLEGPREGYRRDTYRR